MNPQTRGAELAPAFATARPMPKYAKVCTRAHADKVRDLLQGGTIRVTTGFKTEGAEQSAENKPTCAGDKSKVSFKIYGTAREVMLVSEYTNEDSFKYLKV